jgi:peptidyl-tRNA hydrolase
VLSPFRSEELETVNHIIDEAVQTSLDFVGLGLSRAMNIHN